MATLCKLCCVPWRLEQTAESHSLLFRLLRAWPLSRCTVVADHGCSQYTSIAAYDYSWFVSFPMTHGHFWIDFCDVIWNALYEYLVSFLGSIDARTWCGYRLYGPRMGPIDNFSLVTGSDKSYPSISPIFVWLQWQPLTRTVWKLALPNSVWCSLNKTTPFIVDMIASRYIFAVCMSVDAFPVQGHRLCAITLCLLSNLWTSKIIGVASYGHWGACPLLTSNNFFQLTSKPYKSYNRQPCLVLSLWKRVKSESTEIVFVARRGRLRPYPWPPSLVGRWGAEIHLSLNASVLVPPRIKSWRRHCQNISELSSLAQA